MGNVKESAQTAAGQNARHTGDRLVTEILSGTGKRGKRTADRVCSMPVVETVSGLWSRRRKSNLIKWLMQQSELSMDSLALYLGCSKQYLNNKFNRDSFSFEDVMVAAYACDHTLAVLPNDGSTGRRIDPEGFFDRESETWMRISRLKAESRDTKRFEYEQKKAELERMKREYGFED